MCSHLSVTYQLSDVIGAPGVVYSRCSRHSYKNSITSSLMQSVYTYGHSIGGELIAFDP